MKTDQIFSTPAGTRSLQPGCLTVWAWEPGWAACWLLAVSQSTRWRSDGGRSACSDPLRSSCHLSCDRSAHHCTGAKAFGKMGERCSPLAPPGGLSRVTTQFKNMFSLSQDSAGSFYIVSSRSSMLRLPTIYCSFMQGISVDFVMVESYKHSFVWMPVVPQHSCDGGREVGELKAGDCCLETTQSF